MRKALICTLVTATAIVAYGQAWAQDVAEPERYVYGPHMMWWDGGWSGMVFGPLIMILFVALLAALAVLLFRRAGDSVQRGSPPPVHTALDILKERFARGEIDKEEYEARRRVLSE